MLQTYITAVPLQSRAGLAKIAYQVPGNRPVSTRFPVIQIIHDTLMPGDKARVIAIRQQNADTAYNYGLLLQELAEAGIAQNQVQEVPLPENQSPQTLIQLCRRLVNLIPAQTRVHACITYGTKSIPIVIFAALSCAEAIHAEVEVGRLCYGEVRREDGRICGAQLYDMAALYQLSGLVSSVPNQQIAEQVFQQLIWLNGAQEEKENATN